MCVCVAMCVCVHISNQMQYCQGTIIYNITRIISNNKLIIIHIFRCN